MQDLGAFGVRWRRGKVNEGRADSAGCTMGRGGAEMIDIGGEMAMLRRGARSPRHWEEYVAYARRICKLVSAMMAFSDYER